MYYKVYIKITESEKKRLLFILAKVKNSAFDIYKGVKCVHLKKKKSVSLLFLNVLFFTAFTLLFFYFNNLVFLGRLRLFLFLFFFKEGEIFCMKDCCY